MGAHVGCDRRGEAVDGQLRNGNALRARLRNRCDGVEGHVQPPRLLDDGGHVAFHGLFVQGVDLAWAVPPAATISFATRSTLVSARPERKTFAPSRAKVRATAPPMAPPAP
jgi:hypothetical protein